MVWLDPVGNCWTNDISESVPLFVKLSGQRELEELRMLAPPASSQQPSPNKLAVLERRWTQLCEETSGACYFCKGSSCKSFLAGQAACSSLTQLCGWSKTDYFCYLCGCSEGKCHKVNQGGRREMSCSRNGDLKRDTINEKICLFCFGLKFGPGRHQCPQVSHHRTKALLLFGMHQVR